MNGLRSNRSRAIVIGVAVVYAILLFACSGGSGGGAAAPGAPSSDAGANTDATVAITSLPPVDAGAVSTEAGSCASPTFSIVFAPMYSAFIPGSTQQTFSIPAVIADGTPATWTLSDPTQGHLQLQEFQSGSDLLPGVLITLEGTGNDGGQVTVVATESTGACGESVLTITQNTIDDWNIGNARYNDGVALHTNAPAAFDGGGQMRLTDGGAFDFDGGRPEGGMGGGGAPGLDFRTSDGGSFFETDGGTACTNCHGPTATSGPYKTVSHTPEQTGGFSDMDLQNIIWNGEVPDGGYFDPTVLVSNCDGGSVCTAQAMALWHSFHRWTDITSDELPGVICYLRSLTPESQNGSSNFGGRLGPRRDGGARP
jgi:hypothetical protein